MRNQPLARHLGNNTTSTYILRSVATHECSKFKLNSNFKIECDVRLKWREQVHVEEDEYVFAPTDNVCVVWTPPIHPFDVSVLLCIIFIFFLPTWPLHSLSTSPNHHESPTTVHPLVTSHADLLFLKFVRIFLLYLWHWSINSLVCPHSPSSLESNSRQQHHHLPHQYHREEVNNVNRRSICQSISGG